MRTDNQPITAASMPPARTQDRASRSWFWPGIGVATVGLAAGLWLGVTSYQDSQQEIDTFARMSAPGSVSVQVGGPGSQVVYYEGDESIIENLEVAVTDPEGAAVAVAPYGAELTYETPDLTLGRAIASFDAEQIGAYNVEVSGFDTGEITVGDSVARLALPGVLAGLAIAGFSLVAGLALWLYSIMKR